MEFIPGNNLRVALYARVSTEEQRQGQTIDSQVAELERFVSDKGWENVGIYKDEGWSGSLLARPELDRLRDDARRGLFGAVVINDVDRLARDVTHLGVVKRDLESHGVQTIFRKLPGEKSPTYNLMVNILGSFAEFERELIADRTRRGKRHKVEVRKQFLGSIPPYGFRYIRKDRATGKEGTLEIHLEEAAVVRQMYMWVDEEGLSARKVVGRLNRMKLLPRKGKTEWARSSVLRILRSEVYAGVWNFNKLQACKPVRPLTSPRYRKSPKSSNRLRPRSEWIPVELAESLRIIHRDQWVRVQNQLDRNIVFSPRNERHSYLLKGLVHCGACGARFVGQPCHGKFYYRCMGRCKKTPSIQEGHLNDTIWSAVEGVVLKPDIIADQVGELSRSGSAKSANTVLETGEIEQASRRIQTEENRLIDAYRLGILSAAQLGTGLEKLTLRRTALEARKAEISGRCEEPSLAAVKRSVTEWCRIAARRLRAFTMKERQQLLRLLVRDIVFDGRTAKIKGIIPAGVEERGSKLIPGISDYAGALQGNIATTEIGLRVRNGALISKPSELASDELGRNVAAGKVDTFGNLLPPPTEYVPFELERPLMRASDRSDMVQKHATMKSIRRELAL